ncbi:diacylglycerol/lipid kinase family protein [Neobacillus massiliamazoniensis]|uniref:Putative phospholipid kinase n=1 Tax=Neobacillus massiliamazoniensis TaxID=1499688 RepID=A0A0U1P2P5_9BACI|nr:diacylglycerol kinase family protein [Neobacillus massiliamazoniensis]CRK84453.1 putative phospholipid kinase [Neobacillus massiliamazoniensis]
MKDIYFIVNPKAKNGQCLKIWQKIVEQLKKDHIHFLAFFTEYPGHAQTLAGRIASKNREDIIIVAVGGDGTLHEVLNGVISHPNVTLAFIPGGSGNDFSRGFHIPTDPVEALTVIRRLWNKEPDFIDIGRMIRNDQPDHFFINNMGAGFDAVISYEVNRSKIKALLNKLSMGRLIYVYFLLKMLFTYKTSTFHLSIDGKTHIFENTWFVTVSNQPFYGGGMKIAPRAEPDDGLLDITVVHQLSRLKLLLVFISVFWGNHIYFKEVKTFTGVDIVIQSQFPIYVHADGEHIGYTPLKIHLQSKTLRVLTRRIMKEEADLKGRDANDIH